MPTEFSMLAAAIDADNGPLPPFIARLIQHAPESFDDARAGQVAAVVRAMRAAREPVNLATVGGNCPQFLSFIVAELSEPMSPEAAEHYAPDIWQAYEIRRAAAIGEDLVNGLGTTPEKAKALIAAARSALNHIASEANPLVEHLAARLYSPAVKPEEPEPRYFIGTVGICTPANLTTISAQAKAGKSAAKSAMMAATFAGPSMDCLGFQSQNPHGYAVVDLDTEQAPFDHWNVIEQARRRAGAERVPAWLQSYCLTGFTVADVRGSIRITLEQAARQFGGIHSVFIDGVADAARDVNDPAEAGEFVAELQRLAIEFDCPILNIIHVNPGSENGKTRGHLGSQLERKSETNLRLEKDDQGVTVMWADKNRRAPIPKSTGPRFAWCDSAGMHISTESRQSSREADTIQGLQTEAEAVFTAAGKSAICYGDFITFLTSEVHVSKSTAKRRVGQMLKVGVITKEASGFYVFTTT